MRYTIKLKGRISGARDQIIASEGSASGSGDSTPEFCCVMPCSAFYLRGKHVPGNRGIAQSRTGVKDRCFGREKSRGTTSGNI